MQIMKARLSLLDDKRVNWMNITHTRILKVNDGFELSIYWRYKASIKQEIFLQRSTDLGQLNTYFQKFGFAPMTPDLFINLSKIMILTEEQMFGAVERTRVKITFEDGFQINEVMESSNWSWFKQSFL